MTRRQQGKYPDEVRRRTVRLVLEHRHEYASEWAAICSIAAESIIGLYKTELVSNLGPCHGCDDLELETLLSVDWWNHCPLMGTTTPTEKEATYYLENATSEATTLKT